MFLALGELFFLLFMAIVVAVHGQNSYSSSALHRFERRFSQTCGRYPFVAKYLEMQRSPRERYVIYVFDEPGGGGGGGLGDRLGGMITALAFALRTDRQFLILGDKAFTDAFEPYQEAGVSRGGKKRTWAAWEWAGWRSEFTSNMTYNRHCVNPKPKATVCALDRDIPAVKVIKFRGNRAYLCRWASKPSLQLAGSLKETLGVDGSTDLYEVAGCLLRLAMWPSDKLWAVLDASFQSQLAAFSSSPPPTYQLGFHFRCGDSSFSAAAGKRVNKECVLDPALRWNGTSFADDFSWDSPVDLATCGKAVLSGLRPVASDGKGQGRGQGQGGALSTLVYIASDYPPSGAQINDTLRWGMTIKPPEACHVDLGKSNAESSSSPAAAAGAATKLDCSLSTTSQWLMLALSDTLVMQALQPNLDVNSPYKPKSPETAHLPTPPEELGPISAFSRYAAVYSLSKDGMRYGRNCTAVNKQVLSRQTMGNWICDPKMFH
jgi:hypothetical protein